MREEVYELLKGLNQRIMEYEGTDMLEDEIIESMEIMDIVVALEEHFRMEIPPQLIVPEYFMTKDTIVRLAEDALKEQ
ncbi:MAG: hypothetical protein HFI91_04575 [Lachnospiraceae bacterium]|jgi:acyl carrier protein|nr:hypothetical protein [Lachnospiraceae bacterium]